MGKLNRQLLVSSALSAGLVLGVVPMAFAAAPPEKSNAGGSDQGVAQRADQSQAQAPPADQAPAPQANAAATENNAGGSAQAEANRSENARPASPALQGNPNPGQGNPNPGQGNPNPAKDNPNPAGPPGNNGTIKVDMDGLGLDRRNNEPKGGCQDVTIKFFNFDAGEMISVVFHGQAPTRFGQTATRTVEANSDGNTTSKFTFEEIVPAGTASKDGGYHVKVEANGLNHPAGVKKKVFWLRCEEPAPAAATTTTTTTIAPTVVTTPTTVTPTTLPVRIGGTQEEQNQLATITPVNVTNSRLAVLGEVIERSRAAEVAGNAQARLVAAPAAAGTNDAAKARVLGVTVERGALARTGLNALQLLTLGALTLLAGIAAVRASRRKDTTESRIII